MVDSFTGSDKDSAEEAHDIQRRTETRRDTQRHTSIRRGTQTMLP